MDLQRIIEDSLRVFGADAASIATAARDLVAAYGEAGRHYHGRAHIEALLRLAGTHRDRLVDPASIELAIFYHDAVYDPTRSDNEVRSAGLAREHLIQLGAPPPVVERVAFLIDLTRHGATEPPPNDDDALCFLDWDLSVLGAAPQTYDAYAAAIRREYAHVPEDAYRHGRGSVLSGFLAQPAIYRTAQFRLLWEAKARSNIERELAVLTAP
jgi:predicted metal-dependent HD superfamily phosphohydrolase